MLSCTHHSRARFVTVDSHVRWTMLLKDISWCWHWSENCHFAVISESEGDITKVVAGSSDPFFASGFDESIVYCRQSYSDLSSGDNRSKWVEFFLEDSYFSHVFCQKPPRLPSQQVNMWCIHKWFDYWTNMSQRHSYTRPYTFIYGYNSYSHVAFPFPFPFPFPLDTIPMF